MNGAQLHLLVVHLPVVGMLAALTLMTLALVRDSEAMTRTAIGFVVFGALLGAPGYFSGPYAMAVAKGFTELDEHLVEQHAIAAKAAFFASALLAAIAVKIWWDATDTGTGKATRVGLWCAMLAITWLMAWTAHLGGIIRHPEIREPVWWVFPELPR
ncbi:MAG: hypothetical protein NXI31_20935 [bacterium]|nr:hypothetical protein [bacterium]